MLKDKRRWFLLLSTLLLFFLSSCSSNKDNADEVATLFANRLLYNTDLDEYKEKFSDSKRFNERSKEVEEDLENNFATVFEPISGKLSQSEREDISKSLIDKVRETTSYTYTIDEQSKGELKVMYHIKGFDYARLVAMMMAKLLDNQDKIDIGSVNAKHLVTTAYYESLEKSMSIIEPVSINIYFKKDNDKKWLIDTKKTDETDIQNLLFVFMTGKVHDEDYEKSMLEEINQIIAREKEKDNKTSSPN